MQRDSLQIMIELKSLIPGLVYDLRYATPDNFTGQQLYGNPGITCLRLEPAKALKEVQSQLNNMGLGLKIFDAYRPHSVSRKMWELIRDERYVANPSKGSGHNRGLSVDLTIIILSDSTELNMGTSFDNFTDTAHHDFTDLSQAVLDNRRFLKTLMEASGFKALSTEWWHYSWPNDHDYGVLDVKPEKLLHR